MITYKGVEYPTKDLIVNLHGSYNSRRITIATHSLQNAMGKGYEIDDSKEQIITNSIYQYVSDDVFAMSDKDIAASHLADVYERVNDVIYMIKYKGIEYPSKSFCIDVDGNNMNVIIVTDALREAIKHGIDVRDSEEQYIDELVHLYVSNEVFAILNDPFEQVNEEDDEDEEGEEEGEGEGEEDELYAGSLIVNEILNILNKASLDERLADSKAFAEYKAQVLDIVKKQ